MTGRLVTQPAKASCRQGLKVAAMLACVAGAATSVHAMGLDWGTGGGVSGPVFESEVVQSIGRFLSPSRIELFDGKLYVADTKRGHVAIYDTDGVRTGTITDVQAPLGLALSAVKRLELSPELTQWQERLSQPLANKSEMSWNANRRKKSLNQSTARRWPPIVRSQLYVRLYVGDKVSGSVTVFEDGAVVGHLGSGAGEFLMPNAIAVSRGRIYVVDSTAGQVRYYNESRQFEGAFGAPGTGPDQFEFPTDIAIDPATGEIFVSDWRANRISVWDRDGLWLRNIAPPLNDGGEAIFLQPAGLGMDETGNLYVVDNLLSSVTVMDQEGLLVDVFGYQFGQYHTGELNIPVDAASSGGRVYVTSSIDGRVQVFEVAP